MNISDIFTKFFGGLAGVGQNPFLMQVAFIAIQAVFAFIFRVIYMAFIAPSIEKLRGLETTKERLKRYISEGKNVEKHEKLYVNQEARSHIDRIIKYLESDHKGENYKYEGGACFYGAFGTGKGGIAGYIARKSNVPVLKVLMQDLISNPEDIRVLYSEASSYKKCIILIDGVNDLASPDQAEIANSVQKTIINNIAQGKKNIAVIATAHSENFNLFKCTLFSDGNLSPCLVSLSETSNRDFVKDMIETHKLDEGQKKNIDQLVGEFYEQSKNLSLAEIKYAVCKSERVKNLAQATEEIRKIAEQKQKLNDEMKRKEYEAKDISAKTALIIEKTMSEKELKKEEKKAEQAAIKLEEKAKKKTEADQEKEQLMKEIKTLTSVVKQLTKVRPDGNPVAATSLQK